MTAVAKLPRWRTARIRVVDIVPAEPLAGPPRPGLPVTVGWTDVWLRDGVVELPEWEPCVRHGRLEATSGEDGQPSLIVDDTLFRALLPGGTPLPLCLAGYHMSFLHTVMGGPWGTHPRRLCLYRMGRMFELMGKDGDASLAGMARSIAPAAGDPGYPLLVSNRVHQATAVLAHLLAISRLNMLVALSGTKLVPPPADEPFGRAAGWESCPGGEFVDYE